MDIAQSEIACSAFTAKLENGDEIFARNYVFTKTNTAIAHTNPKGRYSSISTIDLQFLGIDPDSNLDSLESKAKALTDPYVPLEGINEKGLSVAIFITYQGGGTPTNQQTEKIDITSTTMIRLMLDYASSVDEAVNLVSK